MAAVVETKADLKAEASKEWARQSLIGFAKHATRGTYQAPRHLKFLAEKLEAVERGEITRLIVSMPPRHGKSWMCSRFFPSWFLSRNPEKAVMLGSYGASFAKKWGGRCKELVGNNGHLFAKKSNNGLPVMVRKDTSAKDEWGIESHEGGMMTAGVGGAFTGYGADLLIIDDPCKNSEEANSEVQREKVWDWYDSTAHSRLEPGGAVVIIMTRWHEDDLVGKLLREEKELIENGEEPEGWDVCVLSAICDDPDNDILNRKEGEALWPERFAADCKKFKRIKRRAYIWSALYQQKPTLPDGNLFKSKYFHYYNLIEEIDARGRAKKVYEYNSARATVESMQIFTTADPAFSEKESADFTVVAVWGFFANYLLLLDLHRGHFSKTELFNIYKGIKEDYGCHRNWMEVGAFQVGAPTIAYLRGKGIMMSELNNKDHGASKDKYARADSAQPQFEEGRVLFPKLASWIYLLLEELLAFPRGNNDDQVDVVSYGVLAAPWNKGMLTFEASRPGSNVLDSLGLSSAPEGY